MNYLLDTHIILWTLFDPGKLSESIIEILRDSEKQKFVSGINLWEISMKYSLGKLDLGNKNPDELLITIKDSGFEIAETPHQILSSYYKLPKKENHKDPFDRMLIWQSIESGFTLLSHDSKLEQYIPDGLMLVTNKI